jgi:hypothetical protein
MENRAPSLGWEKLRSMYDHYFVFRPSRLLSRSLLLAILVVPALLFLAGRFGHIAFLEHKGRTVLIAVAAEGLALLVGLLFFLMCLLVRRPIQYSLRTLLLFAVVIALLCSWLASEIRAAVDQKAVVAAIQASGGQVVYDYDYEHVDDESRGTREPWEHKSVRKLLGRDFLDTPTTVALVSDEEMNYLVRLKEVRGLILVKLPATAARLQNLKVLARLDRLDIVGSKVCGADAANLSEITSLRYLNLDRAFVTDADVYELRKELPSLEIER